MNDSGKRISLILAAAGSSKRMKAVKPKQLAEITNGITLLEYTLKKYIPFNFYEIKIVTGSRSEEIKDKLKAYGNRVEFVFNQNYEKGIGTSIAAGIKSLSPHSCACMTALGDMPLVSEKTVEALIKSWEFHSEKIIAPEYNGRRGNPVIFPKKYYRELSLLSCDRGGKDVIENHLDNIHLCCIAEKGIFFDIDTESDLDNFLKSIQRNTEN